MFNCCACARAFCVCVFARDSVQGGGLNILTFGLHFLNKRVNTRYNIAAIDTLHCTRSCGKRCVLRDCYFCTGCITDFRFTGILHYAAL